MLTEIEKLHFAATDYPITVAEVPSATEMIDKVLRWEERDELIDCLAFQPNVGEPISSYSKIRRNVFEFGREGGEVVEMTVFYFFFDLNMPLFVLALYPGDREVLPTEQEERQMDKLAAALVEDYRDCAGRVQGKRAGTSAR